MNSLDDPPDTYLHNAPCDVSHLNSLDDLPDTYLHNTPCDVSHMNSLDDLPDTYLHDTDPYQADTFFGNEEQMKNWSVIKVAPLQRDTIECHMTIKPLPNFSIIHMMDVMCDCVMMCHDYLFYSEFMQSSVMSVDTQKYTIDCDQSAQQYVISSTSDSSQSLLLPENIINVIDPADVNQHYSYIFPHSDSDNELSAFPPQSLENIQELIDMVPTAPMDPKVPSSTDYLIEHREYNIIIETKKNVLQFFFDNHIHYNLFLQHLREMKLL